MKIRTTKSITEKKTYESTNSSKLVENSNENQSIFVPKTKDNKNESDNTYILKAINSVQENSSLNDSKVYKLKGSILEDPVYVLSHTRFTNARGKQKKTLDKYRKIENILYDHCNNDKNKSANVILTFPDGRNSILIDEEGNETELDTTIEKQPDGKKLVSYTLEDEYGYTYTRTIEYYESEKLKDAYSSIKNPQGQELKKEYYNIGNEKFAIHEVNYPVTITYYEYDDNGAKSKETIDDYYNKEVTSRTEVEYEGNLAVDITKSYYYYNFIDKKGKIKSKEEIHNEYDSNGNKTKETVLKYDEDEKFVGTEETQIEYDNGKQNKTILTHYDSDNNKKKVTETSFDENGNKTNIFETSYHENGNIAFTQEQQFEYDSENQNTRSIKYISEYKYGKQATIEILKNILKKEIILQKDEATGNTIKLTREFEVSKSYPKWTQEILNEQGEVISSINNNDLTVLLNDENIKIDNNKVGKLSNFMSEMLVDDIIYACKKGYDKYLYNIVDYGGINNIKKRSATKFITDDYNKLIYTIRNRKSIEEAFCPTIESKKKALNDLAAGDTCVIDGKLYIKTDSKMEQLDISRKKYLELFPPSARFSISQKRSGDCYILASLYSMETNPNSYAALLKCFSENNDGSVTAKIPASGNDITFTIPKGKKVEDFYLYEKNDEDKGKEYNAGACEGIKALEYLYGFYKIKENIDPLLEELDKAIKNDDENAINDITNKIRNLNERSEEAKGNGGECAKVFKDFGFDANPKDKNCDDLSKIYCGSGILSGKHYYFNEALEEIEPVLQHAYAFRPFKDENGEVKYEVVNPHDTSRSAILSYNEVIEIFGYLTSATVR